jgi:hypothetical protein
LLSAISLAQRAHRAINLVYSPEGALGPPESGS